jgi:hypothetical protein
MGTYDRLKEAENAAEAIAALSRWKIRSIIHAKVTTKSKLIWLWGASLTSL